MDAMQKARARMLLKHVFFATLVLSTRMRAMTPEEEEQMRASGMTPTAWTDMTIVAYSRAFIESLDVEVVIFVIAHEVAHIMFKHGLRRGSRNHERWNIACDFAINLILKNAGFKIWEHALCDDKYADLSAEQIYELREQEREERKKAGRGSPGTFGKGAPGRGVPDNGCDVEPGDGLAGDVRTPGNLDGETRAKIEQQINQTVAQAASLARMAGKMSADLDRAVSGILNPPLPWQQLLKEFANQTCKDDECWSHRNRRFTTSYMPSHWSEAMGELVIIGDTSGSVRAEELKQIGAEVSEIAETVRPERVRVIWADDCECALEEVFERNDPIDLHPKGGGGTDMRKPLAFVDQYNPIVVILVTDGYTPWPEIAPDYPLIVCCTTNATCPDWAMVVRMRP